MILKSLTFLSFLFGPNNILMRLSVTTTENVDCGHQSAQVDNQWFEILDRDDQRLEAWWVFSDYCIYSSGSDNLRKMG